MDLDKVNLDAPALPDADEEEGSETSTEGSQPEQKVEAEEGDAASDADNSDEETDVEAKQPRVPYSRFETVNSEKQEALERAIRAETELELMRKHGSTTTQDYSSEPPPEWVTLYGDTDVSRNAWKVQQQLDAKRLADMQVKAAEAALEGLKKAQADALQRESEAEKEISNALDDFQGRSKRTLSDAEQSAILDVMDELTPKDEEGNYQVSPVHFLDKAVEIYDLRQLKASQTTKESKRKATQLAGVNSQGESKAGQGGKHFQPGNWGSWRDNPLLPKN